MGSHWKLFIETEYLLKRERRVLHNTHTHNFINTYSRIYNVNRFVKLITVRPKRPVITVSNCKKVDVM